MDRGIGQSAMHLYDRFPEAGMERRAFMANMAGLAGSVAAAELLIVGSAGSAAGAAIVAKNDRHGRTNEESYAMIETKTDEMIEPGKSGREALVRRYIEAEGKLDWAMIEALLGEDLRFRGGGKEIGKASYLGILKRLGLVWNGNRVKRIFVDGNEACALYDFLSDTPTGAVPCVEWIRFHGDKISEIDFLFEREKWGVVEAEMMRRARATAPR